MKNINIVFIFLLLMVLGCQAPQSNETSSGKDSSMTLFFGGDILTMQGKEPSYVEAMVQEKGKIFFVGTKAEAIQKYGQAVMIDLEGKTLMPGFIDAHSHLCMGADAVHQANINPTPVGQVTSIADIITEMQALKQRLKANDTTWLIGTGYDQDYLKEKRHPTPLHL
jgi:predicted amidohydrolase YtcJ